MFQGTGTALMTPFLDDLSVDYVSLKKLVEDQIAGGISALIVLGTTGEASVINNDERRKIIETVLEVNNKRAKIIIGTGANDTMKVVSLNKIAEEYPVDGVLIVNPYYNKTTQAGLVTHYKYIAERTSLPIILYNVPSRTGMNVLPETILEIHDKCKNVVAVKEACADISQISRLCAEKPASLSVISGNDDQTLPIMAVGGDGVISVFSNAYPAEMTAITSAMLKQDYHKARELNNKYLKMMNLLFVEVSPSPIKYVASLRGLCKNTLRLPLVPVTESSENVLRAEYEKLLENK
jgi:4-hydroxy-tetrahydrodipicolinate synthase